MCIQQTVELLQYCHDIAGKRDKLSDSDQEILDALIDKLDDQHPITQVDIDWIHERR